MSLQELVDVVRRRWMSIGVWLLVGLVAGFAAYLAIPRTYASTISFYISTQSPNDNVTFAYQGGLLSQQRAKTYTELLSSERVALELKNELGLDGSLEDIRSQIETSAQLDTVLIDATVTDRSPQQAARIANSIGQLFPKLIAELEQPTSGTRASPVVARVVQPGIVPDEPVGPSGILCLGLGTILGLAIGVGIAVGRNLVDQSVRSGQALGELANAPLLGVVGHFANADTNPLVVVDNPADPSAENVRQIRTNLNYVDIGKECKSIVVTSSGPGEGKTLTTCNIGAAMADAGTNVLLIEGDLRRPLAANYLGLTGDVGLTSVLTGRIEPNDAIQRFGGRSLSFLASGPLPPNPSELLGSALMGRLLMQLKSQFDIILIDCPPLGPVTDAAALAAKTDGALLLARYGKTRQGQVARSIDDLNAVGASVLGVVLTDAPATDPGYYGYGYGYGQGESRAARSKSARHD